MVATLFARAKYVVGEEQNGATQRALGLRWQNYGMYETAAGSNGVVAQRGQQSIGAAMVVEALEHRSGRMASKHRTVDGVEALSSVEMCCSKVD